MVTPLVIGLWQCIPFSKLCAPTPWHSICVCITSCQEPTLVVHRGWSVSVTLTQSIKSSTTTLFMVAILKSRLLMSRHGIELLHDGLHKMKRPANLKKNTELRYVRPPVHLSTIMHSSYLVSIPIRGHSMN
jgi:hypothetical protein